MKLHNPIPHDDLDDSVVSCAFCCTSRVQLIIESNEVKICTDGENAIWPNTVSQIRLEGRNPTSQLPDEANMKQTARIALQSGAVCCISQFETNNRTDGMWALGPA